jgi:3-deoxy-7-phosphoheptulonate synthase
MLFVPVNFLLFFYFVQRRPNYSIKSQYHSSLYSRGSGGPNYDAVSVDKVARGMEKSGLKANIMIDLSHANSLKQCQRQLLVGEDVAEQVARGDHRIMGVMIESLILLNPYIFQYQPIVAT